MKLVITKHDVLIIKTIRKRRYSMAEIAANAGLRLTNTHGKVTAMCAKGFMTDSYRSDSNRTGLRAGEKRRVYEVTALGLQAATLFQEVSKSVEKVGAERKASPRSTAKKK